MNTPVHEARACRHAERSGAIRTAPPHVHASAIPTTASEAGFAALLAVIMVAALLAAAVAAASLAGTRAGRLAATREWRAQARALADGCATIAMTRLLTNAAYSGDAAAGGDATFPDGSCRILPPKRDLPGPGMTTVRTRGTAHGFTAFVTIIARTHQRCSPSSPAPYGIAIDAWSEVPSHE